MSDKTTIGQILQDAREQIADISESPRLDAELLLCQALDVPRSYLFAHAEETLDEISAGRYLNLIARRLDGEPLAYMEGTKEFWSLSLMVSPDTLVPRPETELLVQLALNDIPRDQPYRVLDLGTGSGAIALAIAHERRDAQVTATDISEAALGIARENARQLDLYNVEFISGRWTEPLGDQIFDMIVSNPPYVNSDDPALDALRHEPRIALAAGVDGLDDIRVLALQCLAILRAGGGLLLEHGAEQQDGVRDILLAAGWSDVGCHEDLAGLPRVTTAIRPTNVDEPTNVSS